MYVLDVWTEAETAEVTTQVHVWGNPAQDGTCELQDVNIV